MFRNGAVYTVAGPAPWAQALGIRSDTIVHIGGEGVRWRWPAPPPASSTSTAAC